MSDTVEYLIQKKGIGPTAYFIYSKQEGDSWIAGFFPAYMGPDPDEVDEMIFDLANPDHTTTGDSREEAEQNLRKWVEENLEIVERRSERKPVT